MKEIQHEDYVEYQVDPCPDCGHDRPGCECRILSCGCLWKPGDCPLHSQAEGMQHAMARLLYAIECNDPEIVIGPPSQGKRSSLRCSETWDRLCEEWHAARALLRAVEERGTP